jgi:hypothetical protein
VWWVFYFKNNLKIFLKTLGILGFSLYFSFVMRETLKLKNMNIREYYLATFPNDDLGTEINPSATFEGLAETLNNYQDVYDYIGACDSLIRERVFWQLSLLHNTEYSVIYDLWMEAV